MSSGREKAEGKEVGCVPLSLSESFYIYEDLVGDYSDEADETLLPSDGESIITLSYDFSTERKEGGL